MSETIDPDKDSHNLPELPEIAPVVTEGESPGLTGRVKTWLIGKRRDLADESIFTHVSLVAFLAWVGLGADGLSSSCYGPSEAFQHLGEHGYLAIFLALSTIGTVFIISSCYSHIIEEFPSGGGGYLVASKLLGKHVGVISGCALLVDYVLTVTTSIAASGDAIFGLLGADFSLFGAGPENVQKTKVLFESAAIVLLIILNLRGVKESVKALLPIFLLFLVTHVILIGGAILLHIGNAGHIVHTISGQLTDALHQPDFGFVGMISVFLFAYSYGAGTYTGIEAVSNSMPVMREPRVRTAKRTMRYMAYSLALTAGGLMVAYSLLNIPHVEDKTMNQTLAESFMRDVGLGGSGLGGAFILITMICEGALLFVAAQAGFIDGPRVMANMAQDSWAPHWFASLSERLASQNGILLMGLSALAALWYTGGAVTTLVIMYSINVFITFSLSMIGMCKHWLHERKENNPLWRRRLALFAVGGALCLGILSVNIYEKFWVGGWITLAVTAVCVTISFLIHAYYRQVVGKLKRLDDTLGLIDAPGEPNDAEPVANQPTAAILVGGYSGLGVHTLLNAVRFAPNHFKNVIFLSVGVVDSGNFKGAGAVDDLQQHTEQTLGKYVDLARRLGFPSTSLMSIGTDAVEQLEILCREANQKFPKSILFAGQLVFQKDTWYQRFLHNQTAHSLQRRLQWSGIPMVILPTRVREHSEPKTFREKLTRLGDIVRGLFRA
ncbi:MAG TPA: APC family permease [Pirellulales bacterium]|jgi:amino acid transporter|nr:APC family permease [Pirellulales bacterium]